jgi:hypothetical protein
MDRDAGDVLGEAIFKILHPGSKEIETRRRSEMGDTNLTHRFF